MSRVSIVSLNKCFSTSDHHPHTPCMHTCTQACLVFATGCPYLFATYFQGCGGREETQRFITLQSGGEFVRELCL